MSAIATERLEERERLIASLGGQGYLNDPRLEEAMLAVPRHVFLPEDLAGLNDPRLEEAMLAVPRHVFLPEDLAGAAYEDRPLPVGHGQTISAPHMVAMMTTALQLDPGENVLEIGTGVGYHAAICKAMVGDKGTVTSIEYLPELAELARANLKTAGFDVEVLNQDGFGGHPAGGPYDAILVTCAVPALPDAFVKQLAPGGHLVAPVGVTRCKLVVGRMADGVFTRDDLGECLFVNAQGKLGADEPDDDDSGPIQPAP